MTLYTLGRAETYDAELAAFERGERVAPPKKIGRESAGRGGISETYPGGAVWPSVGGLNLYLTTLIDDGQLDPKDLGIYEVDGDWERDTAPDAQPDANWHDLLYDRPIVRRVE